MHPVAAFPNPPACRHPSLRRDDGTLVGVVSYFRVHEIVISAGGLSLRHPSGGQARTKDLFKIHIVVWHPEGA